MLRITETTTSEALPLLRLEGRLIGQWVTLLQENAAKLEPAAFALDLKHVSFVDSAGLELLDAWQTRGITLLNCPLFLQELLRKTAVAESLTLIESFSIAS